MPPIRHVPAASQARQVVQGLSRRLQCRRSGSQGQHELSLVQLPLSMSLPFGVYWNMQLSRHQHEQAIRTDKATCKPDVLSRCTISIGSCEVQQTDFETSGQSLSKALQEGRESNVNVRLSRSSMKQAPSRSFTLQTQHVRAF